MSNKITIELCAEDRARLDRLAAAIERAANNSAPVFLGVDLAKQANTEQAPVDEVQQKLADTLAKAEAPAEAPKNATGEAKTPAPPVTPAKEETPTANEDVAPWETVAAPTKQPEPEKAKPTVTLEQIQQKVVQLASENGGAKKKQVAQIVKFYAPKVSDIPEDKRAEVWDKLTALEMEGKA